MRLRRTAFVLALTAVCLLGGPSAARALFGLGGSNKITLVWIPMETFSDWDALAGLFKRYDGLKLTVGLSMDMVTPEAEKALSPWIQSGRLEVALRLSGDPILPLIAENPDAPRPQDPPDRIVDAREQYHLLFGANPAGFVPGGGAVDPQLFQTFQYMGLSWVATAQYPSALSAWAASSNVALVPLRAVEAPGPDLTPAEISLPDYPEPAAFVIDEADALVPEGSGMRLFSLLADKERPHRGWQTISEALRSRKEELRDAGTVREWPAWTGGLNLWNGAQASRRAWKLYGEAALALDRYLNSGSADVKALESATVELHAAQAGRYYRLMALSADEEAAGAEKELRAHLIAVYRRIHQTPPESLYRPIRDSRRDRPGARRGEPAEGLSTDVHFAEGLASPGGPSWLSFDNPPGSLSRSPQGAAPLADATPADSLWNILGLRVEWDDEGTTLIWKMAFLDNTRGAPVPMGDLILDAYIDINHVTGAGSTQLLEGRGAFASAKDAWEYALTVSGWGAYLYRSAPAGAPVLIGQVASVTADPQKAEVRVAVPRAMMRGNPAGWGYIALALAADPAATAKPPPRPLAGGKGAVLCALAPLEQQKALAAGREAGAPRLAALRARR